MVLTSVIIVLYWRSKGLKLLKGLRETEKKHIRIETVPTRTPNPHATSKVYQCGNVIEVQTVERPCKNLSNFRRYNKDLCIDLRTGEVIEYNHSTKRNENHHGLYKTFANLRRIINLNFRGGWSEIFLTLTYKTAMTDTVQLYEDYRKFWKKLKRFYPALIYVAIAEPQHYGTWHLHVLLRNSDFKHLFIPKEQLTELWPHGFSHVQRLVNIDNLGAYFTAHLTDISLFERDDCEEPPPKKILKGARMAHYPAKFRLYRCSKGIARPVPQSMTYSQAQRLVGSLAPCYESTKVIQQQQDDGTVQEVNSINYQQYNKIRNNNN